MRAAKLLVLAACAYMFALGLALPQVANAEGPSDGVKESAAKEPYEEPAESGDKDAQEANASDAPVRPVKIVSATSKKTVPTPEQQRRAKEIFMAGVAAYRAGDFLTAAQAFEQAYAVELRPGFVFSRAQAYRQHYFASRDASALKSAIASFRQYLDLVPEGGRRTDAARALGDLVPLARDLDPELQARAKKARTWVWISARPKGTIASIDGAPARAVPFRQAIKPGKHRVVLSATGHKDIRRDIVALEGELLPLDMSLEPLPARLAVQGGSGIAVTIDGKEVAVLPLAQDLALATGKYNLVFSENGHVSEVRTVTLGPGTRDELTVALSTTTQRRWAYGLFATGGASMVAGGVLVGLALDAQAEAQSVADTMSSTQMIQEADRQNHNAAIPRRDDYRTAATTVIAGGAALLSLGALLYVFDAPLMVDPDRSFPSEKPAKDEEERGRDLDLLAGDAAGGPGFMLRLRF